MLSKASRFHLLAGLWALLMLGVIAHQVYFWSSQRIDTDVLALLPDDEQQPAISAATRKLASEADRQLILLVGAKDWTKTRQATELVQQTLASHRDLLQPAIVNAADAGRALEFYRPWRQNFLTEAQRAWLTRASADDIGSMAVMKLYQLAGSSLTRWQDDPLGLWSDWWLERAAESRVRPRDGLLGLSGHGQEWVLLNYHSQNSAFAVSGNAPLTAAIDDARQRIAATGGRLLAAGVPLYAEAAAAQANSEMSTIGYGSMAAVLFLVWLTFRSTRPIILVGISLLAGCAVALSVTALLFERVHLLTLVFGASLVGVAEDYGFHYFTARQGHPAHRRFAIFRHLLPGMILALVTSVLAYLALGLVPFPGLQQMAVFSAVGLTAAFLTVVCWFPSFDRGVLRHSRFTRRFGHILMGWPRWQANRRGWLWLGILMLLTGFGLSRLHTQDDIRQLSSLPASLLADQRELGELLGLASPAQFFLIAGSSPEQVLQREEPLKQRLRTLQHQGQITGFRAISDWLPSQARQQQNRQLIANATQHALTRAAQVTGESLTPPPISTQPLRFDTWLQHEASLPLRAQWLGSIRGEYFSVVMIQGLQKHTVSAVAAATHGMTGVQWVDKTAEISRLMGRYRVAMSGLLIAGYLAVFIALIWHFRRHAWRALLPTVLGSLMTLALLALLGEPLQLFNVLALLLLLGMGVDYGIFLLEHPGDRSAWLAVALAGISTFLSFGLLGLSSTPALRAFGLTMLIGEVLVWILTPFFRLLPPPKNPHPVIPPRVEESSHAR